MIQGFFIGGAMRPQPAPRAAAGQAGARRATGTPPPAFAGRAAPLQARMAPGRPPLAHQGAGRVAQPHGGNGSFDIDPVQIGLARGGGKPLPQAVLAKMEAAFGADFSAVRVHVGPQAARIGAVAFTTGDDLYFAPGQFQPDSVKGQQLIGHELAHVIQQRQGRVRAPGSGVAVVQDRMLEAEADRLGMRAAAHRPPLQAKMAASGRSEAQVHISAPGGTSPGSYRLTAGSGPNPVGSLVVHTRRGAAAEVTDLGVAPGHRDQGIGRQLLVSAARAGLRSGNSKLSLSAQDNGTGKLTRWYKDMGFQQVGVNGRGMPVLEAPISRLLAGAVQRRAAGAIQRAAPHAPNTRARADKDRQVGSDVDIRNILLPDAPHPHFGVPLYGFGDGTLTGVGAYSASEGVRTTDVRRAFSESEKTQINKLGKAQGCHMCGAKDSGWADGHFTPDHQPPLCTVASLAEWKGVLRPHCRKCSSTQGGLLSAAKKAGAL
ncbi:MAG TPA: GNAT family N-acetyltransferase [Allosphingosinicella sp.]